jgi:hypothetical protein
MQRKSPGVLKAYGDGSLRVICHHNDVPPLPAHLEGQELDFDIIKL